MKSAIILSLLASSLAPASALAVARQASAPKGGAKLYVAADCLSTMGLEIPDNIILKDIVANQCYPAPKLPVPIIGGLIAAFESFEAYPLSDTTGYDCGFEAYFEPGCTGAKVGNQRVNDGYEKCYNVIKSPEALTPQKLFGKSYKWACCKKAA